MLEAGGCVVRLAGLYISFQVLPRVESAHIFLVMVMEMQCVRTTLTCITR